MGALGEDGANLIVDSFADGLMDVALLPEIADSATEGCLRGLRDRNDINGPSMSPGQHRWTIDAVSAGPGGPPP